MNVLNVDIKKFKIYHMREQWQNFVKHRLERSLWVCALTLTMQQPCVSSNKMHFFVVCTYWDRMIGVQCVVVEGRNGDTNGCLSAYLRHVNFHCSFAIIRDEAKRVHLRMRITAKSSSTNTMQGISMGSINNLMCIFIIRIFLFNHEYW